MINCRHCNTENPDAARFCDSCGQAFEASCRACGAINRASARFCSQCGVELKKDSANAAPQPAFSPPVDNTSREGELKEITILFADVRGSTQLIEALDPESAKHQLDPVVRAMCDAVDRCGGVVNRTEGDGIMALFGAPAACEDHAVRACLAARAIVDSIAGLGQANIAVRVGVDSGKVVVFPTGSDASDYDTAGVTPHLARRMEQQATPGTVLLTSRTARLCRGYVDLASRGPIAIKGITEPVETFELISATARPSWEVRSSVHRLNRFVGRATEFAQLTAALARAHLGRGQVVTIVAEAGLGKSRLVHEFMAAQTTVAWSKLRASAVSNATNAPYYLAAEIVRSLVGVDTAQSREDVARKLDQTLSVIGSHGGIDAEPLRSLLDLPIQDEDWLQLDPSTKRHRLISATRNFVLREATLRPLILFIDDYHWVDQSSAEVLSAIAEGLGGAKLLMIVTSRPDSRPRWTERSYCLDLHLPPLEPESAETLLRELIDSTAGLDALRQQIIMQAGGIPLYVEELARSIAESGGLVADPKRLQGMKRTDDGNVPGSLKAIIASRIDRLPPARRRLLQIASVIGKDVPLKLLRAVANIPDEQLEEELAELQRAELLYELNLPSGKEYTFRHALMHAVAYEEMLRKHRRELHQQVLQATESLFADRLHEMPERLADHAVGAEAWDSAASYALMAGDRAIARWSWQEAIGFFDIAIDALGRLPDNAERVRRAIEARLRLRVALPAAADLPRWIQCLDEARELSTGTGQGERLAEIDTSRCIAFTKMGMLTEAVGAGHQAFEDAVTLEHPATLVNASFAFAQALWYAGEFRRAEKLLVDRLREVRGELRVANTGTTGTVSVLHLVCLSKTYAITGQLEKAFATIAEAQQIAEETGKPFDKSYARVGKGFCHLMNEEGLAAVIELEEALRLARAGDIALLIPSSMRYLGPAYALTGRLVDANDLLHEAIERTTAHGLLGMRIWSNAALAEVQLLSAATEKCRQTLLSTLELAKQQSFRPVQARLSRVLGRLHEKSNDDAEAEQCYRSAVLLSDELGMRSNSHAARRELATLLHRYGRGDEPPIQAGLSPIQEVPIGRLN